MSYDFNGSNQYLSTATLPISAIGSGFTVACWADWDATAVADALVSIGTSNERFTLQTTTGSKVAALSRDGGVSVNSATSGSLTAGWKHCVAVFASTTSRTSYLDGTASTAETTSSDPDLTGGNFRVGIDQADGGDFDGRIAHVAVWDMVLSGANITALAGGANPLTIENANLVAYWPLVDSGDLTDTIASNDLTATGATYSASNPTVDAAATKYLKLLAHSSAASDTGVTGHVFNADESSYIGKFTNAAFEASLEGTDAVLKVAVTEFGGSSLTTSDTPKAFIYSSTDASIGPASCTVIEE